MAEELEFTLKALERDDGKRLEEFFKGLSGESVARFTPHALYPKALDRICREDAGGRYLAVLPDGKAIGYLIFENWESSVPKIRLAVQDEYTGRDVGQRMLLEAEEIARESGKAAIWADIPEDDLRGERAFRKAGFRLQGRSLSGGLLELCGLHETPLEEFHRLPPVYVPMKTRTGEDFVIRSLRADDGERMFDFYSNMSERDRAFYIAFPFSREAMEDVCRHADDRPPMERYSAAFIRDGREVFGGNIFLCRLNESVPGLGIGVAGWAQGLGIGRLMMEFMQARTREYGHNALRLETHPANYRAQKLYKTAGFEQIGFAGDGELYMICDLDAI